MVILDTGQMPAGAAGLVVGRRVVAAASPGTRRSLALSTAMMMLLEIAMSLQSG